MGKGKNGCNASSMAPLVDSESLELQQMVEAGEGQEALVFLLDSVTPFQVWCERLGILIDQEEVPDRRSMYRHLLSALLFEKGQQLDDPGLLFRARRPLRDDTLDLDTSPEYQEIAEHKLRELRREFGYFTRHNPSEKFSSDALRLQNMRDMHRPVLLVTRDEEQEIEALHRAYGDDLTVFPEQPTDEPLHLQQMVDALMGVIRDQRAFAVRRSAKLDAEMVVYLEELAERHGQRHSQFSFLWMVEPKSLHLDGPAAGYCQVLDFSAWSERPPS